MDTAPETLTRFIPSKKGNNELYTLDVKYAEEAQVFSALYQLWTMPEMQVDIAGKKLNACITAQKTENGYVTCDVSKMLKGVDEATFCTNFFQCGADKITLFQAYKKQDNIMLIETNIKENSIVIKMYGDEAESVLEKIEEFLMQPHQVPMFIQRCSHTEDFSSCLGPSYTPERAIQKLFLALQKSPALSKNILVAEEGDTQYRPARNHEPNIKWICAMDPNKKIFVSYHTTENMLTSFNVKFSHK